MGNSIQGSRTGRRAVALSALLLAAMASTTAAQGPQVDIDQPPGAPEGRRSLGPALGSSGTSAFDANPVTQQQSIFGGRPGPTATRVPLNGLNPPQAQLPQQAAARFRPVVLEPATVPAYGDLAEPGKEEDPGPSNGLTLDAAIDRLIKANLNLYALQFEIQMAEADFLTASLRANPIFYADSQLVPYGRYSPQNPGGQTQYDVNVTFPLDVWRKRQARMAVAERAKKVTEAQFQDAVRLQIDNLYTAYVDVVAARLTRQYSELYTRGIDRLYRLNLDLFTKGQITEATVDALRAQLEQAQLQVREATQAQIKTKRTLALLLRMPRAETDQLQVRATLRDVRPLPISEEELVQMGLATRPDLQAYRIGVQRSQADLNLARRNRYSDVFLLYQPYTLQDNRPFGLKSPISYAIGVTVSLPVYNRNQGNIERSKINVTQTQVETANQEQQVIYDVEEAVREFELSRQSVIELEREVVPASRRVRDSAFRRWQGGETSAIEYLEAQKDYNEVVKRFRDALVRHRNAMLDMNTAVGVRILP